MKTTAFIFLAFVTAGFAQQRSNVLLGRNVNFEGPSSDQFDLSVELGRCTNLPDGFIRQLSAIAPNAGLSCLLYDGPDCTGAQPPGPNGLPVTTRVNDLGAPPYFFDDRTWSLNCTSV